MSDQRPRTKAALAPRGIQCRGNARRPEIRRPIKLRPEHEQRPERLQQSSRDGVHIGHRAVIPGAGKSFTYAARQNCIGLRRGAVRTRLELRKLNCPTVCYASMAQGALELAAEGRAEGALSELCRRGEPA